MAFKIAGSMVFGRRKRANPVLLEPLMDVEVRTPEEYMGDVIGDLNSAVARFVLWRTHPALRSSRLLLPLTEMFGYIGDLRGKTQGRAVFRWHSIATARFQERR